MPPTGTLNPTSSWYPANPLSYVGRMGPIGSTSGPFGPIGEAQTASPLNPMNPYNPAYQMPADTAFGSQLAGAVGKPLARGNNLFGTWNGTQINSLGDVRNAFKGGNPYGTGKIAGTANALSRGAEGLAIAWGADKLGNALEDPEDPGGFQSVLGRGIRAGGKGGGPVWMVSRPAGAVVGLGVGSGSVAGEYIAPLLRGGDVGDYTMANVGDNISRRVSGKTGTDSGLDFMALAEAGINPADLVGFLQRDDGDQALATALAIKKYDGAETNDDGSLSLDGAALRVVEDFKKASSGKDTAPAKLLNYMARNGIQGEEANRLATTYSSVVGEKDANGEEITPERALDYATQVQAQEAQSQQEQQDFFSKALAFQALTAEYLKPVTGQMMATADATYENRIAALQGSGLTPGQIAAQTAEAKAQQQMAHTTANLYAAQIALTPQVTAWQDYQAQQNGVANQLMQGSIQAQLSGNPYGGGGQMTADQILQAASAQG